MRPLALASLAALVFSASSHAEKFYFGPPDKQTPNDAVSGVLIKETDKTYVIRIVGGQIEVEKRLVTKRQADGLTLMDIDQQEKQRRAQVAEADHRRQQIQAAEASARRQTAERRELEQPKEHVLHVDVDFGGLLPGYRFKTIGYDPVLHRMNVEGLRRAIEIYLQQEAQRAAHRHIR